MAQINDCMYETLGGMGYTGQLNDRLLQFYHANGATSSDLSTAAKQALVAMGVGPSHINDMWMEYFGSLGHTGALSDRMLQYWCGGGGGPICTHQIVTAKWFGGDGLVNGFDATHGSITPTTLHGETITELYVVDGLYLTVLDFGGTEITALTEIYLNVDGNSVTLTWNGTNNRYEGTGTLALYNALDDYGNDTCISLTDNYVSDTFLITESGDFLVTEAGDNLIEAA